MVGEIGDEVLVVGERWPQHGLGDSEVRRWDQDQVPSSSEHCGDANPKGSASVAEPSEDAGEQHGVEEQVHEEPQVVPREVRIGITALEGVGIPLEEGAGEVDWAPSSAYPRRNALHVDLGRDDQEHPGYERYEKPPEPLQPELVREAGPEGIPSRHAGEKEEQRHMPLVDEVVDFADQFASFGVLDVERIERGEHHPGVKQDQEQRRCHAQSIDFVAAGRGRVHDHGPGNLHRGRFACWCRQAYGSLRARTCRSSATHSVRARG